MKFATIFASALGDFKDGLVRWRVWVALANEEISDQHRRTTLGPLWLVLNYLAFAAIFILIFKRGEGIPNYEAYVAVGLFVWLYISETIVQSVSLFVREENFIKGTTLPLSVYVLRLTMQSIIRAGYMLAGCILLLLIFGAPVSFGWVWALLGFAIIFLTTPAAIVVFAMGGAFFPDIQFVVQNVMRLGMFLTPIFWTVRDSGGVRRILADWNPFAYYLEIIRTPILTGNLPTHAFILCISMGLILWLAALLLTGRFRKQIVFVL